MPMFMLMLLSMLSVMGFLVLWHWLWLWRIWLKGRVWVGGGSWWTKEAHGIRVKTTGWRSFGLCPWICLYSTVKRRALEHWMSKHGGIVLWAFHWWTLKRWKWVDGVLVSRMSLHTVVTRVSRATSPLQRSDRFVCHLVHWFVQQSIPEEGNQMLLKSLAVIFFDPLISKISFSIYEHQILNIWVLIIINLLERWTFLTPGALIILCFYIWSCPLLHSEGHCLFYNIGTVVPSRDRDKQCQKTCFPVMTAFLKF